MDRKAFFKEIGLKFGKAIEKKIDNVYDIIENENELDEHQKHFLVDYSNWLTKFQAFVFKRSKNPFDIENQKQLMLISEEAETRRPSLELHMNNVNFAKVFNTITSEITDAIAE